MVKLGLRFKLWFKSLCGLMFEDTVWVRAGDWVVVGVRVKVITVFRARV